MTTGTDGAAPLAGSDRGPIGSRLTLAWQVTLACALVALVATVVAGLISARLLDSAARDVTRDLLADQADVVAAQVAETNAAAGSRRLAEVLRGQDIAVVLVGRTGAIAAADSGARAAAEAAGVDRVVAGDTVSSTVDADGRTYVVEARPARAGGFALIQRVDASVVDSPRRPVLLALLGGGAAAAAVGLATASVIARPLRRTAAAAGRLGAGHRDVEVPVEGPREVAEVAHAVNALAGALAHSERRQRDFLLSVSHELRTPLTSVIGFAESLAEDIVESSEVPAVGRTISMEGRRLERLVNDLLMLARLEADDFPVDATRCELVGSLAEAASVWSARAAEAGVEFRFDHPPAGVPVHTDPRRLRQVVDALADNALRVTPSGALLVLAVRRDGDVAVVEVRDGGPGLTPADREVAFERGVLHDRYSGTRPGGAGGLGLALVHRLVTRLGATIQLGDAPEGGASFTVRIPSAGPPGRGESDDLSAS